MPHNFYPLSTAPAPYDIVWCRFPYVEEPELPGPENHPGLIRQAFADQQGNPWVRVVYGTSVDPNRRGNQYFTISKVSELDACGLLRATRFCFDRCMELPWAAEYFEPPRSMPTPIIGCLTQYAIQILQVQMSYYQRDLDARTTDDELPLEP